jgi:hypothetical protein
MAQTNFTPISLYYSATASSVPVNTNLTAGELAINTNDGKLFYKDSSNVVQTLASKAAAAFPNVNGSTSGAVTLAAPAVAGTNTATFPAATGTVMVSGNMPAFSANTVTAQSFASSTFTKVQYNVETFDTNSNYDPTTNYRFTPTVAGYYQINANVSFAGSAVGYAQMGIYKNGGFTVGGSGIPNNVTIGGLCNVSSVVYCNGSTDYIEIYAWQSSGGALALQTGAGNNTFSGCLVRGA